MDKISAQELRVGNWVICHFMNSEIKTQVIWMTYDILEQKYFANVKDGEHINAYCIDTNCKPIPLTPELLERCGFDGNPNTMKGASLEIKDHERVFKSISIYYNNDTAENQYYLFMREGAKDEPRTNDGVVLLMRNLQYLHQLQNLYYALTGIELDVKM